MPVHEDFSSKGVRVSPGRAPSLGGGCYFSVDVMAPCLSVCFVLIY